MFILSILVIGAAAIWLMSLDRGNTRREDPQTDDAYVGGDITQIGAKVGGYVVALPVDDNQPVRAGQLIALVEDRDYSAERAQAQANVQSADAQLASLKTQQRELAAQIEETRASEGAFRATSVRTSPEVDRQRMLLHTDVGQSRNLEEAVEQQRTMVASIASAHAQYVAKQRQAGVLEAQQRQAAATLDARRADLTLAELNLGWTRIVSPIGGVLGARAVREGDLLNPGSTVVSVTPLDTVWVDANFVEKQITDIRPGQPATLVFDSFPQQAIQGRVAGSSPITGARLSSMPADNATGNYTKVAQRLPVRIAVACRDNPLLGLLRPGMSAVVTVHTGAQADPSACVPPATDGTVAR